MFILFVYLVFMNLLMIKTEENVVLIEIKAGGQQRTCFITSPEILRVKENFSLEVRSDYFIKRSSWNQTLKNNYNLQEMKHSKFSITYERSISSNNTQNNSIIYTYSLTQKVHKKRSGGTWNFEFELLKDYDPWTSNVQNENPEIWTCHTSVKINSTSAQSHNNSTGDSGSGSGTDTSGRGTSVSDYSTWLIIFVSLFGILLLVQSSYIIYGKAKSGKSKKNNDEDPISPKSPKTKRGSNPITNIADRPPLPLPPDEAVKEDKFNLEPKPLPPMSPEAIRHHLFPPPSAPPLKIENTYNNPHAGPLVPKQSYRNKGLVLSDEGVKSPVFARRQMEGPLVPKQSYRNKELDNSDDDLNRPGFSRRRMEGPLVPKQSYRNKPCDSSDEELSPGFPRRRIEGPLVPKQSYRNKALENSEEELRTPGFARRQIEAKLAQLPPKAVTASKSFKLPKPLPRLPPTPPPEKAPAFHPAHRKEPVPLLHLKKLPVFPPPAPCRQPDPRLSDVDWQYETLEPASKYLNNLSDVPYDNMM